MYKKVILIIGLGWQQLSYIKFLRKKNYYLIGIDESPLKNIKKYLDFLIIENIYDTNEIFLKLKKLNINKPYKIISFLSDTCEVAADKLRKKYKLYSDQYEKIEFAINKEQQLKELKKNNINFPKTFFLSPTDIVKERFLDFPIIIKPSDSSGSRGVIKINDRKSLFLNISKIFKYSRSKRILIQKFLDGKEFSIEGYYNDGNFKICLISKRYKKKFVSAKIILPIKIKEREKKKFEKYMMKICKVLRFKDCFIHAEVIYNNKKFYLIDISPRLGGFGIDKLLLPNYIKSNIKELYINFVLGLKNTAILLKKKFTYSALVFIFSKNNFLTLKKKKNKFVSFHKLNKLVSKKEEFNDSSRSGIYHIKCNNIKDLNRQMRRLRNL